MKPTINYAHYDIKHAGVWSEFGEQFARRKFGDAIVDALPRKTRGPHKGSVNATITWVKVLSGGWVASERDVERRVGQIVAARLTSIKNNVVTTHAECGDVYLIGENK